MRKNAFIARDHIEVINIFRISKNGELFTKKELQIILKNGRIPSNEFFISILCKSSIIIQVEQDQLKFTSEQPIYYKMLEQIYKDYQKKLNAYNRAYRKKKNI